MAQLKLAALDEQDLTILSAHVQDAVMKVRDLRYMATARRFLVPMNRFAWETQTGLFRKTPERRNAVLQFDRVGAVKFTGIARERPDEMLNLLAVGFETGEAPAGAVNLVFSGGGAIRLDVECVEARLADLGGAWEASSRPRHRL